MTLLRLPLVTKAIVEAIRLGVTTSPAWPVGPMGPVLNVTPEPPDQLSGDHTIGFYLYHAIEDAAVRNAEVASDPSLPQRHTPMGLRLSYILTAHSDMADSASTLEEQFLMGLAMRALRDWPILTDDSQIAGTTVFPQGLVGAGNRIHICEDMIQPSAAVDFWAAGSQPLRLAAYYQVSAVLLEPPPGPRTTGPVLQYGVHTFARSAPRLESSRNRIDVTLPDAAVQRVELRPAQVPIDGPFELIGSDLAADETLLKIHHPDWDAPVTVDTTLWGVTASETVLTAAVRAHAGAEVVLPGLYSATAVAAVDRRMPDGSTRRFLTSSNATPITVVPRIDTIGPVAGASPDQRVQGARWDPTLLDDDAIRLFVGHKELDRVATGPAMAAGKFHVVDEGEIRFRHAATAVSGETVPFRLLVRGAESAPRWVKIP